MPTHVYFGRHLEIITRRAQNRRGKLTDKPRRRDAQNGMTNKIEEDDIRTMKKTIVSCVLVGFFSFCIGCSSSYMVSSSPGAEESFPTFNADAKGKRATVVLRDVRQLFAKDVIAGPDSTSFLNVTAGVRIVLPTHEIDKIVFANSGLGFLEGAGIGLLAGGVGGLAAAAIIVGRGAGEEGLAYVILPLFGGGGGLLLGGIIGGTRGHSYEYKFVMEPTTP
jgi:hypothetical protein